MPGSTYYDPRRWGPTFRADLYVSEVAQSGWSSLIRLEPPPGLKVTQDEIEQLLVLAGTERAAHLADIEKQADPVWPDYFAMLAGAVGQPATSADHPRTFELMWTLIRVGSFLVNQYKDHYKRNRPSFFDPRLTTAIAVPAHPSYPSGHSTQAHLLAHGLGELVPSAAGPLVEFAWDVAVNRERAGLHYRTDTEAGRALAAQAFDILRRCPRYVTTMDEAYKEWR
jgi:acid phosphatase (class A)